MPAELDAASDASADWLAAAAATVTLVLLLPLLLLLLPLAPTALVEDAVALATATDDDDAIVGPAELLTATADTDCLFSSLLARILRLRGCRSLLVCWPLFAVELE